MALTVTDLLEIEADLRFEADRLRKDVAAQPPGSDGMKLYTERMTARARRFDQAADLVMGMQGDWASIGPLLRAGYQVMAKGYEATKAKGEKPSEVAAA